MTSRRQISLFGEDEWTFLQEDSHAKTQVRQNNSGKDSSGLGVSERDFGGIWRVRSTRSGHDGLSQRMLLTSQELTTEEILQRSSMSWPDWGMMRNGRLCTLQMRVRPTEERGVTWLLTPTASDYMRENLSSPMYAKRLSRSAGCFPEHLYRLGLRGLVNHRFVAWIMGFPENHLSCMANLD